jgi:nucleotide-binding universal stress UspA family protein
MTTDAILVGVDGSTGSEGALRWAVREARLRPGRVTALFGWRTAGNRHGAFRGAVHTGHATRADRTDPAQAAAAALDRAVTDVVGPGGQDAVNQMVVEADPVEALLRHAGTAEMIVVGAGHGPAHRMLVGPVSQGVMDHARVPIVVVRGAVAPVGEQDSRPVVVGIDGSPSSLATLTWAVTEAHARGVQLRVVHAWDGGGVIPPDLVASLQQSLISQAQRALDAAVGDGARATANVDAVITRDPPVLALLRDAGDAQLLVVGGRRRAGLADLALGSVSHQCVLRATCPVAVVPDGNR